MRGEIAEGDHSVLPVIPCGSTNEDRRIVSGGRPVWLENELCSWCTSRVISSIEELTSFSGEAIPMTRRKFCPYDAEANLANLRMVRTRCCFGKIPGTSPSDTSDVSIS